MSVVFISSGVSSSCISSSRIILPDPRSVTLFDAPPNRLPSAPRFPFLAAGALLKPPKNLIEESDRLVPCVEKVEKEAEEVADALD